MSQTMIAAREGSHASFSTRAAPAGERDRRARESGVSAAEEAEEAEEARRDARRRGRGFMVRAALRRGID